MLKFGDRLRAARERKGLSQMDVYRAIGLNNKSLSRYENGTTAPDPDTLRDLIRLYDVSSDYTHSITAPYLGLFWVISLDFFLLVLPVLFSLFLSSENSGTILERFSSSSSSGAIPRYFMYMVAASFQKSEREY